MKITLILLSCYVALSILDEQVVLTDWHNVTPYERCIASYDGNDAMIDTCEVLKINN